VLRLAVEQNQDIVRGLKSKIASGLALPIDWPKVYQLQGLQPAPYTYNLPLDARQVGKKVKRIIYAPFTSGITPATTHQMYDHANNLVNDNNSKVTSYYTELDNQKMQRDNVQMTLLSQNLAGQPVQYADDYMLHKKLLKDTCYYNLEDYRFNWVHIDAFDSRESNQNTDGSIMVDGYDLVKPVNWTFNAIQASPTGIATVPLNTAIVLGQKLLKVSSSSYVVE
jgi:hypothetical protein